MGHDLSQQIISDMSIAFEQHIHKVELWPLGLWCFKNLNKSEIMNLYRPARLLTLMQQVNKF